MVNCMIVIKLFVSLAMISFIATVAKRKKLHQKHEYYRYVLPIKTGPSIQTKYSKVHQVKVFKGSLPQTLFGPFLNTLSQMMNVKTSCNIFKMQNQLKQITKTREKMMQPLMNPFWKNWMSIKTFKTPNSMFREK